MNIDEYLQTEMSIKGVASDIGRSFTGKVSNIKQAKRYSTKLIKNSINLLDVLAGTDLDSKTKDAIYKQMRELKRGLSVIAKLQE
jgi:hypothetical protein